MHGSFDKPGNNDNKLFQRYGIGFLVLPVVLVIALLALAIDPPATSSLIAEAVQAEFAGIAMPVEEAPTQMARPAMQFRSVRAY